MSATITISPGSRVVLTEACPWRERRGCVGVVVRPRSDGVYPQPAKSEVLVLLDRDPLDIRPYVVSQDSLGWSCVVPTMCCEVLS